MSETKKKVADFAKSLKNESLISIYAADCESPYKVQRILLTRTSRWLECKLSGKFSDDHKPVEDLRFPNTSTETRELLLYWIFAGTLACVSEDNNENSYDPEREELFAQVRLWIFADELRIPKLQNTIMQRLDELGNAHLIYPSIPAINYAYTHSNPNSCLRRFMIDQVCRSIYHARKRTSQKAFELEGYSAEDIGSLHGAPGFTEHLLAKIQETWKELGDPDATIMDITKWYVNEGTDGRGAG